MARATNAIANAENKKERRLTELRQDFAEIKILFRLLAKDFLLTIKSFETRRKLIMTPWSVMLFHW